jgi:hypothetical protein
MPEDSPAPTTAPRNHLSHANAEDEALGYSTADKALDTNIVGFSFLRILQEK